MDRLVNRQADRQSALWANRQTNCIKGRMHNFFCLWIFSEGERSNPIANLARERETRKREKKCGFGNETKKTMIRIEQ